MIEIREEDAINRMPWYTNNFYDETLNDRETICQQFYAQMMGWA